MRLRLRPTRRRSPSSNAASPTTGVADLAERLGLRDEFTEGKTWEEWMETALRGVQPPLGTPTATRPSFAGGLGDGLLARPRRGRPLSSPCKAYVEDPEGRPRTTPSGKIELYSERLATIRDTWTFHNGDRDVVRPVPSYFPEIEGVADVNETYPAPVLPPGRRKTSSTAATR